MSGPARADYGVSAFVFLVVGVLVLLGALADYEPAIGLGVIMVIAWLLVFGVPRRRS